MRIAHVTATFPPYWAGTGNVAYHNARLMHERGHEVTVFTAKAAGDESMTFPFAVERLPAWFRIGNAPLTPSLVSKLRGFDLIHLHYPYIFGAELALTASKRFNVPFVLTYHNQLQESHPLKRLLFGLYNAASEPAIMRGSRKILAVRKEHLVSLHPQYAMSDKVSELPNGVETSVFRPRDKAKARAALALPEGAPVALFVGALDQAHRSKNVPGLLRAFAALELQEAHLLIVGEGDLKASFKSLSTQLGLEGYVRFLGMKPPEELPSIYSAADVTVMPSVSQESFGLPLIESHACGTPVIASDLPGLRSSVEDGYDGLVIPPNDIGELRDALSALLRNSERALLWGRRGREKVEELLDWQVIGDKIEQIYQAVFNDWELAA